MFMKKVMVAMMTSALLIGTLPVESATFGKSSSTSTRSSTFSSGSTSRSSSFSSPSSSSRSTSTYSSASTSKGGISQGSSIGMSRSNVANSVKNGTYSAPANGTTVAGSNPGGYSNNSGSYSNNRSYNNGSYNGGYNNGGYNNTYQQPQGHSTGTVVGAAAAGALAGYALGSHNNNNGTTVVVPGGGYNAPVVAGNGGYVSGNGAPVIVDNNGNYTTAPVAGAPMVAVAPQSAGSGIASFIWTLIKIIVGLAILYFIVRLIMGFFSRSNNSYSSGSSPVFNTKTPEDEIRDMKENFFIQFQQNNRPSGLNHIRQNSTPVFYNAVEDMVREQSDTRSVKVRQIEAELVDLTQEGSRYIASVRYHAVVAEGEGSNLQDSEVKELWNFVYEGNAWKLAGIDQL